MDQAHRPSTATNFKEPGQAPSGDALAGEGSPSGARAREAVAARSLLGFRGRLQLRSLQCLEIRTEPVGRQGPSIDGCAVKQDCLTTGPSPQLSEACPGPSESWHGGFQTLSSGGSWDPWLFPQEEEQREDRRRRGRGWDPPSPPARPVKWACAPRSRWGSLGPPGSRAALTSGHRRAPLVSVHSRSCGGFLWVCDGHPACPKPCLWPAWSRATLGLVFREPGRPVQATSRKGPVGGRGDAPMGTPHSPSAAPGGRTLPPPPRCLEPGEAVLSCFPKTSS